MRQRFASIVVALIATWGVCMAGTGLVREDVRTSQFTLYDNYFSSCKCSLVRGIDSTGVDAVVLALTFEEPEINIDSCDEVSFKLRNGNTVSLKANDRVRRGDVKLRRFKNATLRYVTRYYALPWYNLEALLETDSRLVILKTTGMEIKRNIKDVKREFELLCNGLNIK